MAARAASAAPICCKAEPRDDRADDRSAGLGAPESKEKVVGTTGFEGPRQTVICWQIYAFPPWCPVGAIPLCTLPARGRHVWHLLPEREGDGQTDPVFRVIHRAQRRAHDHGGQLCLR